MEAEKTDATIAEVSSRFGALTFKPEQMLGIWVHRGQRFEENNVCLTVDVEDTPETAAFFAEYKQVLKQRFRQIEIYIVSYEVRLS